MGGLLVVLLRPQPRHARLKRLRDEPHPGPGVVSPYALPALERVELPHHAQRDDQNDAVLHLNTTPSAPFQRG
eukprot:1193355-Prorocentrum_minimum.AAC.1